VRPVPSMTSLAPMPRRATGTVESYAWKDGRTLTWRLRVRAFGKRHRIDLGTNHEGWNEERARVELERITAMVERGTWQPQTDYADLHSQANADETIHVTASRWWQRRERELRPNTRADYRWRLNYVLADLAKERTAELTARRVNEFRDRLARRLSPRSVNMVLDLLAQVLDDAVEDELLDQNPARGRRRRMKVPRASRSFLEPDMVLELLDVAGEWEASLPEHQRYGRRALLALLCLAGPRISEAITADRGDFDLAGGRWRIPAAKTDAGERDVELPLFLADELREHVAAMQALRRPTGARKPMWPTLTGGRLNPSNVRNRLFANAVEKANERRAENGGMLLPGRVTPHTLRRTFASLALTAGRDPRWVMGQIGHSDARLTLSVYAQVMQRQRVDHALILKLMRFSDEPKRRRVGGGFGPMNGPTTEKPASKASASVLAE